MPKVSKARKQRQESAALARNSRITYLSRQASPSSSVGATSSISAASTPLISIAPSEEDFEEIPDLDAEDQFDFSGYFSKENSPIIISPDSSDVEIVVDEGYNSDDTMSEMEGEELMQSLKQQMAGEIEVIGQIQATHQEGAYGPLMRDVYPKEWAKIKSSRSLGYNKRSRRTKQRKAKAAREAEEVNEKSKKSSV